MGRLDGRYPATGALDTNVIVGFNHFSARLMFRLQDILLSAAFNMPWYRFAVKAMLDDSWVCGVLGMEFDKESCDGFHVFSL
jgi:hypothetical protein